MADDRSKKKKKGQDGPKIHKTLMNDIRRGGFKRTLKQDFNDIYNFYIDKETRHRLASMSRFRRWFRVAFLILKSLILKLSPIRRVLLVISLIFIFSVQSIETGEASIDINMKLLGYFTILLILMLELKDKLLAKDELAAGRAVQKALMPETGPQFPGWDIWMHTQPANEVGGDLVDYIALGKERMGLVIGDVSGKGLGAAIFSTRLQATLRALAPHLKSMKELGAHMNNIFCRDCLPQFFASLVYLELSSGSDVRFINAGHMPPFLVHDNNVEELPQGGPALGILKKTSYNEQRATLHPGDLLCFYSDGVTEARNEQGEFFGEERLQKSLPRLSPLSSEEIGTTLLDEIKTFIGDARVSDDLSMIIVKRTS